MFEAIEKDIGIPIVSIVYDGTTAKRNEVLAPYVHYILQSVPPSGGNQYWTSAM
jgi:hypothetical protein